MASKRNVRRKMCGSKVGHATLSDAAAAIGKLHRKKGWQGNLHAYRCPHCGKFHVGHVPGQNSSWMKRRA